MSIHNTYPKSILLFFAFLLPFSLFAQQPKGVDTTLEKALLWKISGNGMTHESYLYGTIHYVPSTDVDTPAVLRNTLYSTNALYLEIVDTTDGFLPDSKTIQEFVGKWYFKQIKKAITKTHESGRDTSGMYNCMPWLYSYIIMGASLNCNMTAYEIVLTGMATNKSMPVLPLESYEDRDSIMRKRKSPSIKEQAKSLENFIDNLDRTLNMYEKNLGDYKAHNITNLYLRTTYTPIRLFSQRNEISKMILDKRNGLWVPRMEFAMKNQSCFFAVGAAHLAGEKGLISLLRQKGYLVTPIF